MSTLLFFLERRKSMLEHWSRQITRILVFIRPHTIYVFRFVDLSLSDSRVLYRKQNLVVISTKSLSQSHITTLLLHISWEVAPLWGYNVYKTSVHIHRYKVERHRRREDAQVEERERERELQHCTRQRTYEFVLGQRCRWPFTGTHIYTSACAVTHEKRRYYSWKG